MQDLSGHFVPFSKDQRYRNLPIQCKKIWIKARLKLHHLLYNSTLSTVYNCTQKKALVAVNFCLSGNYKRFFIGRPFSLTLTLLTLFLNMQLFYFNMDLLSHEL